MAKNVRQLLVRPSPPSFLCGFDDLTTDGTFMPAPELVDWIKAAFLDEEGPLHYPGHVHLNDARICALWTNAENAKQGRKIVGQAEMPKRSRSGGKWQQSRSAQQLREWFGIDAPDFLLTFDALYCSSIDDNGFAALVDHELCHCAQETDAFGAPKFNQDTGRPMFTIRGHDVQEFVSVVERFGIEAAGEAAVDMVIAAAKKPSIAPVRISQSCGTCAIRRAA